MENKRSTGAQERRSTDSVIGPSTALGMFRPFDLTQGRTLRAIECVRGMVSPSNHYRLSGFVNRPPSTVHRKKGFTLIELMLVVIIIGALVAMVMPRLTGRGEQARIATAKADIQANIATALKLYELDNGNFPSTEDGLNGLLNKSGSANNWCGPYLEKRPIDPWGREYKYRCPGDHRPDYDLYSLGKDGIESEDDVKNWE